MIAIDARVDFAIELTPMERLLMRTPLLAPGEFGCPRDHPQFDSGGPQSKVPDIYAPDWSDTARGRSAGRPCVHSGADEHRLLTRTGETAGEGFETTLAATGDVDRDGRADLIVGSWQCAGAASSGGRAVLFSRTDGRRLMTFAFRTPGDTFGFNAVGLGDVDGDGSDDLLITSGWSGDHGFHPGRVFIVSSGIRND